MRVMFTKSMENFKNIYEIEGPIEDFFGFFDKNSDDILFLGDIYSEVNKFQQRLEKEF